MRIDSDRNDLRKCGVNLIKKRKRSKLPKYKLGYVQIYEEERVLEKTGVYEGCMIVKVRKKI